MKPAQESSDLAGRLKAASATAVGQAPAVAAPVPKRAAAKTQQVALRPSLELWARYINAAAERSKSTGKHVTPQQIALEVLERAL